MYFTKIKMSPSQPLFLVIIYEYIKQKHKKTRVFKIFMANAGENATMLRESLKQTSVIYCLTKK